jgi:hypothetical protein
MHGDEHGGQSDSSPFTQPGAQALPQLTRSWP